MLGTRSRRERRVVPWFGLIIGVLVATALIAVVGCSSNPHTLQPAAGKTSEAEPSATPASIGLEPTETSAASQPDSTETVELGSSLIPTVTPAAGENASPTAAAQGPIVLSPTATTAPASYGNLKQTRGLFAVTGHNKPFAASVYSNPAVDGIVIRTFWNSIEPAPDQFNWGFIDGQVQAAASHGKQVILIVIPGAFTPDWALQGVQTAQFDSKYGFTKGQALNLPLPWDSTYLQRWFAFVQAMGQRYDPNPAVVMVPAAGPTSISAEMSLPNQADAVAQWQQLGYSVDKYENAWSQTLAAYAQAFPTSQIGLVLYPGLPIPDAAASDQTRNDITSMAFNRYGRKISIQTSGLSARKESQPTLGYELVRQYSTQTTVGFEMGTSATKKPARMGGGTATDALRATIDFGLAAGAHFLIIYEKDIVNPAEQGNLMYAHTALSTN